MSVASSGSIQIPFLGEWGQLRRERRELRERLAKLEYEQGRFSESVLARVRVDYERKIHDLEARSADLAERAQREVDSLTAALAHQESEVLAARVGLEEYELREKIGEQLDDESMRRAAAGRKQLTHLEDDLRAMRELLTRVRAIAEGRTGSGVSGVMPAMTGPIPATAPRPATGTFSTPAAALPPLPPARALPPTPPVASQAPVAPQPELLPPLPPPVDPSYPPYSRTEMISVIAVPRLIPVDTSDSADHFALRPKTVVGRTAECDLRLPVGTVSRRHAELEWTEEGWRIHDLQSENGTWVNGERAFDRLLVDGDRLQFGTVCLVFKTT